MSINKTKYDKFISDLEIINSFIPVASWKLYDAPPKRNKIENEVNLEIMEPEISPKKDKVSIRAALNIKGKAGSRKKDIFEISLLQDFIIKVNPELVSKEILDMYIQRNALLSIVVVFRERIKYITFQMGLPPLILPALKISSGEKSILPEEKTETENV